MEALPAFNNSSTLEDRTAKNLIDCVSRYIGHISEAPSHGRNGVKKFVSLA